MQFSSGEKHVATAALDATDATGNAR